MNILIYLSSLCRKFNFLLLSVLVGYSANSMGQATVRASLYHQQLGETNDVATKNTTARVGHRSFLDEDGNNLLTYSLNYWETHVNDKTLTGSDKNRKLRALVPELNLMKIIDEEYSLILNARPAFYGALEGSMEDDFRFEAAAVVTKFVSDSLTLGLGVGRGTALGRDLIVPLFQFLWFASDNVVVRGLLPIRASVWYIPNQKWEFGGTFNLQGSLYNLDNEDTDIPDAENIGFATASIGAAARYKMFGNHFLSAELGTTVLRRYEWNSGSGPSTNIGQEPMEERELDNAPYLRVGWLEKF